MSSSEGDRRGSFSLYRPSRRRHARGGLDYRRSGMRDLGHRERYERRLRRGSRSPSGRKERRHHRSHRKGYSAGDSYNSGSSSEGSQESWSTRRRKRSSSPKRRTSRYTDRRGRYRNLPRRSRRRRTLRSESSESESSPFRSEYDSTVTEIDRKRKRLRSGRDLSIRFRVGDKVDFKYRAKSGKMWLPAQVSEVEEGMYGELLYKIYLPDLGKMMHYVSADELRPRRRLTKRDAIQERRDIWLVKNARRQHALEELWVNGHPRLVPQIRDEYDRGRSRCRFRNPRNHNHINQRASSAIRQRDHLVMGVPKTKWRASSLPPARYTWPMLLAEFASHLEEQPCTLEVPPSEEQDVNELKDADGNEDYHKSGIRAKAPFEVTKETGDIFIDNVNDNDEHLNITQHDHEVQKKKRNRDVYYTQPYNHDGDLLQAPNGGRVSKSNPANFSILVGNKKNGHRSLETPININFLFPKKGADLVPQRWE